MAAIQYRGLNAVTNFDLSRYIKWLRPGNQNSPTNTNDSEPNTNLEPGLSCLVSNQAASSSATEMTLADPPRPPGAGTGSASSALGLLLQSSKFKEMLEGTSVVDSSPPTSQESDHPPRRSFPDDIQTYFDCQDSGNLYAESEDIIFGDLNSIASVPIFDCEHLGP